MEEKNGGKRRRLVNSDIFLDVFRTQNEYDFFILYLLHIKSMGLIEGILKVLFIMLVTIALTNITQILNTITRTLTTKNYYKTVSTIINITLSKNFDYYNQNFNRENYNKTILITIIIV